MNTETSNSEQALQHPKVKAWLDECRTIKTRRVYTSRVKAFFKFYKGTVDEFLLLPANEKRHFMLTYQNTEPRANTSNSTLGGLNSFLETVDMKVNFKGKRRRVEVDLTSHHFSNGDLAKMFELGNTKEKALISLACSLGWEVSSILGFPRKQLQSYIDRAKAEDKKFYYFMSQRPKTGAHHLGVLNPLCIEWVSKWLIESKDIPMRKRKADKATRDRVVSEVFDITEEGANKILRRLASEAHISTTGRVHFHKLRGWVMNRLSGAGWNEWQVKFLVGKTIPATDSTYLYGLREQIEERYPKAFEEYLNLQTPIKAVVELNKSLEQKDREMKALQEKLVKMELQISNLQVEKTFRKADTFEGFSQADLLALKGLLAENKALQKKTLGREANENE